MRIDTASSTWDAVTEHALDRLRKARKRLEQHGLDVPQTEFARGEIKALSAVLALADQPRKAPEISESRPATAPRF